MIVTRLIGGLGNQMFQYAAGLAVAQKHQVPLKLDVRGYAEQKLRWYSLNNFQISSSLADASELPTPGQIRSPVVRVFPGYRPHGFRIRRDYLTGYNHDIFSQGGNLYVDGYWQSEKYFLSVADRLRQEFQPRQPLDRLNQTLVEKIQSEESASVHIRRGDYVNNSVYAVCSLEYYRRAIDYLMSRHPQLTLYIFSDDPGWAQTNLNTSQPTTYVTHNQGAEDYKDLVVMSHCRHHIIANSSFSWWGAWLGTAPDGIVIAPQSWYTTAAIDNRDVIPERWIRLAN